MTHERQVSIIISNSTVLLTQFSFYSDVSKKSNNVKRGYTCYQRLRSLDHAAIAVALLSIHM